jgi:hypothetical protein
VKINHQQRLLINRKLVVALKKVEQQVLLVVLLEDPKLVTTELRVNQTTTSLETHQSLKDKKLSLSQIPHKCLTLKLNS